MAISRAQLLKELLPGLNALFGLEYAKYGEEHKEIFETETSERSFEEETKLSGFSAAPVKNEGSAISYDNAQEAWTARYQHETIALGFSVTEEAVEDNLYDSCQLVTPRLWLVPCRTPSKLRLLLSLTTHLLVARPTVTVLSCVLLRIRWFLAARTAIRAALLT
jgi:hypothetical protein